MKSVQITVTQYEVGDVLDISDVKARSSADSKDCLTRGKKAIVVSVRYLKDKSGISYKLLTDDACVVTMQPREQGAEKYIGHIDLKEIFEGA